MNVKMARKITAKAKKQFEKEAQKKANVIIKSLKVNIKRAAKKGVRDFRTMININDSEYTLVQKHFSKKGFVCLDYLMDGNTYLTIEW